MTSPPSVVFHPPTNPYSVVMATENARRSPLRTIVLLVLVAVLVVGGLAFNQWLERASTAAVTPAGCVDGDASTAAAYRARTEAIANVGETEVAGVVICR